jgi:uncharacterized membrane protein (UPF0182 family)
MVFVCREFCSLKNRCLTGTLWGILFVFLGSFVVIILACFGWFVNRYIFCGDDFFSERDVGLITRWFIFFVIGYTSCLITILICIILVLIIGNICICTYNAWIKARQRASTYEALEMSNQV